MTKIKRIQTKKELRDFQIKYRVRKNWHEPNEQGINARVVGKFFDNAGMSNELTVILIKGKKELAEVNLAMLFAWSTKQ